MSQDQEADLDRGENQTVDAEQPAPQGTDAERLQRERDDLYDRLLRKTA